MGLTVCDGCETPGPFQDDTDCHRLISILECLASRYVKSGDKCEDLVSDAFLKAWRTYGLRLFQIPEDECRRLFAVIVRSVFVDTYYRDKRWSEAWERLKFLPDATRQPDPSRTIERKDALEKLEKALKELEDRERTVFVLREMRGWTFSRIATHLDVTTSTVFRVCQKACKKVQDFYVIE